MTDLTPELLDAMANALDGETDEELAGIWRKYAPALIGAARENLDLKGAIIELRRQSAVQLSEWNEICQQHKAQLDDCADLFRQLQERVTTAETQLADVRAALEYYAEESNHDVDLDKNGWATSAVSRDGGEKARLALGLDWEKKDG